MASLILGITGKKRSGKDTFAARLIDAHGFTRIGFADALKATMEDLNPWVWVEPDEAGVVFGPSRVFTPERVRLGAVLSLVGGWERAKEIREVRRLLQAHGVSIRDHVDPDVWVNAVERKAAAVDGPVVITDVRFPNEADFVDPYLVRIVRPGLDSTDTHISETAMDGYPALDILNDGTVADLHAQADALVERLDL